MTLTDIQDAARLAKLLLRLRKSREEAQEQKGVDDIGLSITSDHDDEDGASFGVALLVGKDVVLEVLDQVERRLIERLRQYGVEP